MLAQTPVLRSKRRRAPRAKKARVTVPEDISSASPSSINNSDSEAENDAAHDKLGTKPVSGMDSTPSDIHPAAKAAVSADRKTKRKRKSHDIELDEKSESTTLRPEQPHTEQDVASSISPAPLPVAETRPEDPSAPSQPPSAPKLPDHNADFESLYLRQVTQEFANDLEKLRSANDFKDSSVPVLIRALKQGAECFSEGEKRVVLGLEEAGAA